MKTFTIKNTDTNLRVYLDRTFAEVGNHTYLLATPSEPGRFFCSSTFAHIKYKSEVVEDEIQNYKYAKNHLSKFVKKNME